MPTCPMSPLISAKACFESLSAGASRQNVFQIQVDIVYWPRAIHEDAVDTIRATSDCSIPTFPYLIFWHHIPSLFRSSRSPNSPLPAHHSDSKVLSGAPHLHHNPFSQTVHYLFSSSFSVFTCSLFFPSMVATVKIQHPASASLLPLGSHGPTTGFGNYFCTF